MDCLFATLQHNSDYDISMRVYGVCGNVYNCILLWCYLVALIVTCFRRSSQDFLDDQAMLTAKASEHGTQYPLSYAEESARQVLEHSLFDELTLLLDHPNLWHDLILPHHRNRRRCSYALRLSSAVCTKYNSLNLSCELYIRQLATAVPVHIQNFKRRIHS